MASWAEGAAKDERNEQEDHEIGRSDPKRSLRRYPRALGRGIPRMVETTNGRQRRNPERVKKSTPPKAKSGRTNVTGQT